MTTRVCVLLVLLGLFAPRPASAAVAHVQTLSWGNFTPETSFVTGSITTTSQNLLICGVIAFASGSDVTNVTLNGSTAFTADQSVINNESLAEVWSLPNIAAGTHTVTVTFSISTQYKHVFCTEVSGAATSSPLDGAGITATGTSAAPSTGSYSATGTSFWYALVNVTNTSTLTAGSGWTIPTNGTDFVNIGGGVEYRANPGSGSLTGDFVSDNLLWAALGVAYKVLPVGGGAGARRLLRGCCR